MPLISDYMNKDHKHCDDACARAEERAAAGDCAGLERDGGTFLREIERHIGIEEKLLFPAFEEETGMTSGPTETMRAEHEEMRGMFAQMRAAIQAKNSQQYLEIAQTLHLLLQQHNTKEETMMYPMLDQSLGDDAQSLLTQVERIAA
jgi:hemerythrin-like domain-containing protein